MILIVTVIFGMLILLMAKQISRLYSHIQALYQLTSAQTETISNFGNYAEKASNKIRVMTKETATLAAKVELLAEFSRTLPGYEEFVHNKLVNMEIDEMTGDN